MLFGSVICLLVLAPVEKCSVVLQTSWTGEARKVFREVVREIGMAVKKNVGTHADIKEATIKNITSLLTAAFGLVAALAWNSAIQKIFSLAFGTQSGLYAMISYAVVVTIIAVVVTVYLGRVLGKLGVVS